MFLPQSTTVYPQFDQNSTFQDLIQRAKDDIILADHLWLPQSKKLFPFQRVTMRTLHEASVTWLEGMRGSAKSYLDARAVLCMGLMSPLKVVFTGPTFRQAMHPFNYVDTLIKENWDDELPLSLSREQIGVTVRGSMEAVIRLQNGTVFKALPMGNGERLRGERADILVCDEFFLMEREMFQSHILPFLLGHAEEDQVKKIIMSTSAEFEDSFAFSVLSKRVLPNVFREDKLWDKDPTYKRQWALLSWDINDLRAEGYNLKQDVLDLLLEGANEEEREQALFNKWKGTSGQFFPANLTEKMSSTDCRIEYSKDNVHSYGMTVDVARSLEGDNFVIHVFKFYPETQKMHFVNSFVDKGLSASEMAAKIYHYDERFDPEWILMDKGGGGMFVRDELMKSVLEFQDGKKQEVKPKDFIIEWNENRAIPGRRKLIFNRVTDEKVGSAFADDRSRGGEYIHNEDIFAHLLYDGLRKTLLMHDIPILIPAEYGDEGSEDEPEAAIYSRIREAIQQLRLLRMDVKTDGQGNKQVVYTKVNTVPRYKWKHATKDSAVAFCYSYILFSLMFREAVAKHETTMPIFTPTVPEGVAVFEGIPEYLPGQIWNPFLGRLV